MKTVFQIHTRPVKTVSGGNTVGSCSEDQRFLLPFLITAGEENRGRGKFLENFQNHAFPS